MTPSKGGAGRHGRVRIAAAAAAAAALLAACGGGGGGPSVSSMSATPTSYGRLAVWTVSGLDLDRDDVTLRITRGGCADLAELGERGATQRQWSCRVTSIGPVAAQVGAGSAWLATLTVDVPPPLVRLTVAPGAGIAGGTIDLELDPVRAPLSVDNFLAYVEARFYDGTIFHRVIPGFVVQGGGFVPGTPGPTPKAPTRPPIVLESNNGLSNQRGTLAMARTSEPDSATSQFYVNVVDNPSLDYRSAQEPGYAVFGKVTAGLDVVDAIAAVPTRTVPETGQQNVPVADVVVTTARQIR